jgi:predicted DNA-binding protein with PD1-like motif
VQIRESSQGFIVALDPGEELVCSLTSFARQYDVDFAAISGFGSISEIELGARLSPDQHRRIRLRGAFELCLLQGAIGLLDGEPFPHLHAVLSRPDFTTVGGLAHEAVCGVSVEILIQPRSEPVHSFAQHRFYWDSNRVEADA